jgi:lysophospholipase L1-like esterase
MPRSPSRFWLWTAPVAIALAAAIVLGTGFVLALRGAAGDPIGEPAPPPRSAEPTPIPTGVRRLLVIGDSLARGTGDETGRGFAGDVLEAMRRHGHAELVNLGVNGMESPEIRGVAESANVRGLAAGASLILVSAGANDLSHSLGRPGASASDASAAVGDARRGYAENLRAILTALRAANPTAPIGLIGLYDPFSSDERAGPGRLGSSVILQWNALAAETALSFPGVFVVPTFDLFQGREDRLSADKYHPNAEGYRLIAERILQVAR